MLATGMQNGIDDDTAASCLAALGHPTRLKLYRTLVRAGPDGAPVGALQESLGVPASTLSHHVQALAGAGLVVQERNGRVPTRADYDTMNRLIGFLTDQCCQGM